MNIQGITPGIAAPQLAQSASSPRAVNSSSSTGTGSTGVLGSSTNLQETFLNLLVTELQNQDPTSPVDPTQMVGQMVSLNQLDQLIAINQTLTGIANGTTPASTATAQVASSTSANGAGSALVPRASTSTAGSQPEVAYSPVDPNALVNLYSTISTSSTNTGGK